MGDTMLQHYKAWVDLCVYTQTTQYTPTTSLIPKKGLHVWPGGMDAIAFSASVKYQAWRRLLDIKYSISSRCISQRLLTLFLMLGWDPPRRSIRVVSLWPFWHDWWRGRLPCCRNQKKGTFSSQCWNTMYEVWGIAWRGINIYLICGNTVCVSTCWVDYVHVLLINILLQQSRFSEFGRLLISEKNCPAC